MGLFVTYNWNAAMWLPPEEHCMGKQMDDYGDAPEGSNTGYPSHRTQIGQFPSSAAAGGATATVLCNFWIGEKVTGEADYNDPNDPDPIHRNPNPPGTHVPNSRSDYDDGIGWVWYVEPNAGPSGVPAELVVSVQVSSIQGGQYVVNVLQDHNMDGDWSMDLSTTRGEWVIVNQNIIVPPGHSTVELPSIRFPTPDMRFIPECFWMRVAVTTESVNLENIDDFGWNGKGPLGEGEIEDVLVHPTPAAGDCRSPQPIQ